MLDGLNPDGSARPGGDEFLPEGNYTNPLDAQSMGAVMIQNLLAELDVPEEWYFNHSTRTLYYYPNRTNDATGHHPPTGGELGGRLGVVRLQNLLRIEGAAAGPAAVPGHSAGWHPASNITVRGIGFRDAGSTILAPHGVPSGGGECWSSPCSVGLAMPAIDEAQPSRTPTKDTANLTDMALILRQTGQCSRHNTQTPRVRCTCRAQRGCVSRDAPSSIWLGMPCIWRATTAMPPWWGLSSHRLGIALS
jgi:hypothetical protein